MATTLIICTPGGADDNCYITAEAAEAYFVGSLREAQWVAWEQADRERALIQATAEIERLGGTRGTSSAIRRRFVGVPRLSTQALHFPRAGDTDAEGVYVIPAAVQEAVCEQAFWLLHKRDNPELLPEEELRARGVQSVAVDGYSQTYRPQVDGPAHIAPRAWALIKPYIRRSWSTAV